MSKEAYNLLVKHIDGQDSFILNRYDDQLKVCNFSERIRNCEKTNYHRVEVDSYRTFQGVLIDSQTVDFANVILIPIASAMGIIINIINIRVIAAINLNKTPEDQQQKTLVRFMLTYSIVNLIYCAIHLISLISKCIDFNSVFCSDLYVSEFGQYYKIIFVEFTASCLKTISNVIYFCTSANRYILLEKESKLARFINGSVAIWTVKKRVLVALAFLILIMGLNTHKIFIYKVVYLSIGNLFYNTYPDLFFSLPVFLANSKNYENNFNYESSHEIERRSIVYEVFTYVNFALNDIALFLVFTLVDVLLIVAFKNSMQKKKVAYADKLNDEKVIKLLNDMEQGCKKLLRVIIVNTLLLLTVKVFDLFMSISKFKIWKEDLNDVDLNPRVNGFCHSIKICSAYEELVKIAYMFYYCFSIVNFNYFNKNFRLILRKLFMCKKSADLKSKVNK